MRTLRQLFTAILLVVALSGVALADDGIMGTGGASTPPSLEGIMYPDLTSGDAATLVMLETLLDFTGMIR